MGTEYEDLQASKNMAHDTSLKFKGEVESALI